ncbi:MAG: DUF3298 and DUF4163 domain-containing protein [Clostridia bacterium]|nr:DUF3298 and DUF4163 domain-containing protein [Clostridia bacterium]
MQISNLKAVMNNQKYDREFIYKNVVVLNTSFDSFIVGLHSNEFAEKRINSRVNMQLSEYLNYNEKTLFPQAVEVYNESVDNDYPIRAFESILDYTVTFNQKSFLSSYRDQYDYTGGAHGNTLRKSETWSLSSGKTLPLAYFFPQNMNYNELIIKYILEQAEKNMESNSIYFENYAELIVQYYNSENYYLTESGLAIYFQQYEIAPYSTGIVVFTIPYALLDGVFSKLNILENVRERNQIIL